MWVPNPSAKLLRSGVKSQQGSIKKHPRVESLVEAWRTAIMSLQEPTMAIPICSWNASMCLRSNGCVRACVCVMLQYTLFVFWVTVTDSSAGHGGSGRPDSPGVLQRGDRGTLRSARGPDGS